MLEHYRQNLHMLNCAALSAARKPQNRNVELSGLKNSVKSEEVSTYVRIIITKAVETLQAKPSPIALLQASSS